MGPEDGIRNIRYESDFKIILNMHFSPNFPKSHIIVFDQNSKIAGLDIRLSRTASRVTLRSIHL